jgi:hypothetical protein
MLVATAVGNLDQAKPVAAQLQAHRLGVDGERTGAKNAGGKILFMKMNGHSVRT